jgi:ectoine hydroxylase-related dioxygenase (phytanoyl-CoA dioxygenase family)
VRTDHPPITDVEKAVFEQEGYVVVPGVLGSEQLAELRSFCEQLFDAKPVHNGDMQVKNAADGRGGGVRNDIALRYPELRFIMSDERILGALRSLLGDDFVFVREMAAHDSRYGYWHKDTTPMERAGLGFHYEPDFRMVQCAIYLQDNDEFGGGLDIVPGSHRERDHTPPAERVTFLDRVANKLGIRRSRGTAPVEENGVTIASRAGDLVIFDVLANHQATQPPGGDPTRVPEDKRKFAIFFVCGANNEHTRAYRQYIEKDYAYLQEDRTWPPEVQELIERERLTLL